MMKHNINLNPNADKALKAQKLHRNAVTLLQAGQMEQGIDILKQAIKLAPGTLAIINNLGKALLSQSKLEEAEKYFKAILDKKPDHLDAQTNLAQIYLKLQHYDRAEQIYKKALEHNKECVAALIGLGTLMNQRGRTDEALNYFNKVISLDPDHPAAWFKLIALLEFKGKLTEASEKIDEARLHLNKNHRGLDLIEARLLGRQKKYNEAAALLEKMKQGPDDDPYKAAVYFQLGKNHDAQNKPSAAFPCIEEANKLTEQSFAAQNINHNKLPARLKKLGATFTKEFVRSWQDVPPMNDPSPVFLVGFPRSGTTLLDQILSSHPAITVAEEKPALMEVRHLLGEEYPENLATLTPDKTKELRQLFFEFHDNKQNNRAVFVDKMPLNLHEAGLAYRLFPQAKFILAQRHPCDCVLSCFMQEFTLNPAMINFMSLKKAAEFYNQSFALWEQYCDLLPLQVHYIRYEDVVSDFKPTVAAMLDFLEQPWDDAVFAYDKTAKQKTAINTPSYYQVTEKIYDSARYRWIRYQEHMTPVIDMLAPWAKKYGYRMSHCAFD